MNKTLKVALCGIDEEEKEKSNLDLKDTTVEGKEETKTITMSGPLGHIYTKALAVVFARKDMTTGQPVMESQANDAIMALMAAKAAVNDSSSNNGVVDLSRQIESNKIEISGDYNINAFVIDPKVSTVEDVISAKLISNDKPDVKSKNFFVIDYNGSINNLASNPYLKNVIFDLQDYCDKLDIEMVLGINGFINVVNARESL